MARRGRCRCGFILKFHRGENGYKTRCPECGAVVRLRRGRTKVRLRMVACACGYKVLLPFEGASAVCPSCARTVTDPAQAKPVSVAPASAKKKSALKHSSVKKSARQALPAPPAAAFTSAKDSAPSSVRPRSRVAAPCAVCLSLVPPESAECPACGATVTHETPPPIRISGPRPAAYAPSSHAHLKVLLGWLGASAALLVVGGIILAMMLWR
jgi:hypothetical protein